jgi:uncharacterized surface protein with fasciclin (FAS1) repeats
MTRYLQSSGLRSTITNPNTKFSLFLLSDQVIQNAGFSFNTRTNQWNILVNGVPTVNQAVETLDRLINLHIVIANDGATDDLSGAGIVETLNGEYIKFNNNKIYSAGNSDPAVAPALPNPVPNVTASRKASNGNVYYIDNKIPIPARSLGLYIRDLGTTSTQPYYLFFQYLFNSGIYVSTATAGVTTVGDIAGITSGTFYTAFIPTNAAMMQAAADGFLPPLSPPTVPTWTATQKTQVVNFIYYHIIPKFNIVPNGKDAGSLETNYIADGDAVRLSVSNTSGAVSLTDVKGRQANVIIGSPGTNVLGNRSVLHQIDKYLVNKP